MLNSVNILGRLTGIPEIAYTGNEVPYTRFRLAVDRDYKDSDGNRVCDFINCIAWRQTAQFIHKYFTKGQLMAASGRLESANWNDGEGNPRYKMELRIISAYFAGSNRSDAAAQTPEIPEEDLPLPQDVPDEFAMLTDDEQLPF